MKNNSREIIKTVVAAVLLVFFLAIIILAVSSYGISDILHFNAARNRRSASATAAAVLLPYSKNVIVRGKNSLFAVNQSNAVDWDMNLAFESDAVRVGGDYLVVYSHSGELAAFHKDKKVFSETFSQNIITARINRNGYLAVALESDVYNAEITVYNRAAAPVYRYQLGSGHLLDLDISPDCSSMALTTASSADGGFSGRVEFIRLDSVEPFCALESDAPYIHIEYNRDGSLLALAADNLDCYNQNGTLVWSRPFESSVICADLSLADKMALAISDGSGGANVIVYDRLGTKISETHFRTPVSALSTSNAFVAAATAQEVAFLGKDGSVQKTVRVGAEVRAMALFSGSKRALVFSGGMLKVIE